MAKTKTGRTHVTDAGVRECEAQSEETCKAKSSAIPLKHFESSDEAQTYYEQEMNKAFPSGVSKKLSRKAAIDEEATAPLNIVVSEAQQQQMTAELSLTSQSNEILGMFADLTNNRIPEEFPAEIGRKRLFLEGSMQDALNVFKTHQALASIGYYARVTKKMARNIADEVGNGVILDPMAGKGYLVKALREQGCKAIGTDDNSWEISDGLKNMDAEAALKEYGNDITHLVISWAPYESDIDKKLFETVQRDYPHITVINIGEYEGGCTGSEELWEIAKEKKRIPGYETSSNLHDVVCILEPVETE